VERGSLSDALDVELGAELIWDCFVCGFEQTIIGDLEVLRPRDYLTARIDFILKPYMICG
jgi:hypothetical protein